MRVLASGTRTSVQFWRSIRTAAPGATGLYDPLNEHDACGIALVAKLWGDPTHAVVEKALDALENLEHRGARGRGRPEHGRRRRDPHAGARRLPARGGRGSSSCRRPAAGDGVGVCYLPTDAERRVVIEQLIEETIVAEGQRADLVARRPRR